jgi:dihydrofolate reductase
MRKLVWLIDQSLDGFMSGPNGDLSRFAPAMTDEMWDDLNLLLNNAAAALFGRATYQNFEAYWPAVPSNPASPKNELDFSHWIDETPKFVTSRTLKKLEWKNSILLNGDVADQVSKLKDQSGKNILIFGSRTLALQLVEAGLIDEMQMRIHPLFLGVGQRLFITETKARRLQLVESRALPTGLMRMHYVFER